MPEDIYLQELGATADPRPSSSSSAVAAVAADDDGSADEQAMLAGGHTPSRWNRCRFCCRICRKMSSEKRHVREHIIKDHGLSMPEYEASYGDCEVHTEYFFCGVCHAEVKHNLKNISLHLHNVHNISPPTYEEQFGRLVEEHAVIGRGLADQPRDGGGSGGAHFAAAAGGDADSEDGEHLVIDEEQAMGQEEEGDEGGELGYAASHFLTGDHGDGGVPPQEGEEDYAEDRSAMFECGVPPVGDIKNPRNKFCRACNRDFNRRQAFVEHCRNIHAMKINFGSNGAVHISGGNSAPAQYIMAAPPPPPPPPKSTTPTSFPCEFCGKVFSNRSNRNRHKILSCEARRDHLQAPGDDLKSGSDADADMQDFGEDYENDGVDYEYPSNAAPAEIKCPYPDCDVTQVRSALMKRHLFEAHHIQNVSVAVAKVDHANIKREPVDADYQSAGSDEERKVPPLRVKLKTISTIVQSEAEETSAKAVVKKEPSSTPTKEFKQCTHCPYRNRNHYILDRHEKACFKRKMSTESFVAKDLPDEDRDESEKTCEVRNQEAVDGTEEDNISKSDADEKKEEDSPHCDDVGELATEEADETCSGEAENATEAAEVSLKPEGQELPPEPDVPNDEEEKHSEDHERDDEMGSVDIPSRTNFEVADNVVATEESTGEIDNMDASDERETTAAAEIREDGEGVKDPEAAEEPSTNV